jgi:hypothetical protein
LNFLLDGWKNGGLDSTKRYKGKTSIDSVIHSDGWRGYNGLVDFGYKKHFRVYHGKSEFARGNSHINGIESFGVILKQDW